MSFTDVFATGVLGLVWIEIDDTCLDWFAPCQGTPSLVIQRSPLLGEASPFFPGILLVRKPSKFQGKQRLFFETHNYVFFSFSQNGTGINPRLGLSTHSTPFRRYLNPESDFGG